MHNCELHHLAYLCFPWGSRFLGRTLSSGCRSKTQSLYLQAFPGIPRIFNHSFYHSFFLPQCFGYDPGILICLFLYLQIWQFDSHCVMYCQSMLHLYKVYTYGITGIFKLKVIYQTVTILVLLPTAFKASVSLFRDSFQALSKLVNLFPVTSYTWRYQNKGQIHW